MWFLEICAAFILFFVAIYIFGALILFAFAKLGKDEEGNLLLDPESWHFKITYAEQRFHYDFFYSSDWHKMNLCKYIRQFSRALFIIWPFIIVFWLALLVAAPIFFLFGKYPVLGVENFAGPVKITEDIKWMKKWKILPIHVGVVFSIIMYIIIYLLPEANAMAFDYLTLLAWAYKILIVLAWILGVIAAVVLIYSVLSWLCWQHERAGKGERTKVGLMLLTLWAWKKSVCLPMKLKNIPKDP